MTRDELPGGVTELANPKNHGFNRDKTKNAANFPHHAT
jgi:hypothetical protein